jgi:thiol-disulfide isomerase/thioredoxin
MSATPGSRILWLFLSLLIAAPLEAGMKPTWPSSFSLVSLDGKRNLRAAAEFKGQPLLIQFWASWCRSCSGISNELERLVLPYQKSKSARLHFLSVSIDESTAEAQKTVEQRKSTFLSQHAFHDSHKHLSTSLKIESVPTIVLVDRDGTILLRKEGHLSASEYLEIKDAISSLPL